MRACLDLSLLPTSSTRPPVHRHEQEEAAGTPPPGQQNLEHCLAVFSTGRSIFACMSTEHNQNNRAKTAALSLVGLHVYLHIYLPAPAMQYIDPLLASNK
jgi:hypothetical protein